MQVDLGGNSNFSGTILTCPAAATTTATTCTIPGLARGTYPWRVIVNGNNPGTGILRTLFIINGASLPAPTSVILSEVGSVPPYYRDNYLSDSEISAVVNVEWTAPAVIGATVVSYDIQFGTNASFTPVLASVNNVVGLSTPIPPAVLAADGAKYVRVRARYQTSVGEQPGGFTAAKLFTVDTGSPGVATLTAPLNGLIIATRTPTLTWKAVPGAVRYHVELLPFSGPPVIIDTYVTTTSLIVPNALGLQNSIHFWRVTAYDAAGNPGAASDFFSFRVAAP